MSAQPPPGMDTCCPLALFNHWRRGGRTDDGARFACPTCGRTYRKRGFLWDPTDPVQEILDFLAGDPRAVKRGPHG